MNAQPLGTLYIVTAPSGAGKTTLVHAVLEREPGLALSISYTTRAPRPGEVDGRDYRFVSREEFLRLRDGGELLEWAEVHGNYYGTSRTWIETQLQQDRDVLLEIDWQGARQVRRMFPHAVSIFILPPSLEALEARLRGRGTDSEATIARRLAAAREEMRHVEEFDYVIINDRLERAIDELTAVVRAARLRLPVQKRRHAAYFAQLLQE
ncbi:MULTISPECIES: guanylate kinase [Tepidiphilus]|jgi:guanylate kinase|uniref:Guanylate kinase n=1 Tax=Tepidiphilus thermophilus TaxID=876478 RepID=A0A0K6INL1_9PROT|nr:MULTISPECIES: guanylate kinase [Tepidiphilus]CUB04676.1 guanylate kinase [Tepidiphilus thermophilus]